MNDQSFEDVVARLCEPDSGFDYDAEAWYLLRDGVDRAFAAAEGDDGSQRHVTAKEICEAVRDIALEQFGPMTLITLSQWGVFETADFGRMVMALVGEGILSKSSEDSEDGFADVFDFEKEFDEPFLPPSARPGASKKKKR